MSGEFNTYTTVDGDRWDLIAWDQYADPFAFEILMRANPLVAPVPVLAGGIALQVPLMTPATVYPDFTPWQS